MKVAVNGKEYKIDVLTDTIFVNNLQIAITDIEDDELVIDSKKYYIDFFEKSGIGEDGEEQSLMIINGLAYVVSNRQSFSEVVKDIRAPISGKVINIPIQKGSIVKRGQSLVVLEAMKMYNEIKSPINGKIKDICVNENQSIKVGELLIIFD